MSGDNPLRRPHKSMMETRRLQAEKKARAWHYQEMARKRAEHENPSLVAGSIYGVRAFSSRPSFGSADSVFGLYPLVMSAGGRWRPGWNSAMCTNHCRDGRHRDMLEMHRRSFGHLLSFGYEPRSPASVAMDCRCGFHAFTDVAEMSRQLPADDDSSELVGIVQGAGKTVVASAGFRCERARVVALVEPPRTPRPGPWLNVVAGVICLASLVLSASSLTLGGGSWWDAVVCGVMPLLVGVNGWFASAGWRRRRPFRKLAAEFGVPVYPSRAEAVAAFPLGIHGPDGRAA